MGLAGGIPCSTKHLLKENISQSMTSPDCHMMIPARIKKTSHVKRCLHLSKENNVLRSPNTTDFTFQSLYIIDIKHITLIDTSLRSQGIHRKQ